MFTRKRRLKKEGKTWNIKNALALLLLTIGLALLMSFLYLYVTGNANYYFNPLLPYKTISNDKLEENLVDKKISFKKISQENGFTRVVLKDDSEIIFSTKKDIANQVSSLQLTLTRLTIEGKKLKSLDFRFDNPVISFR